MRIFLCSITFLLLFIQIPNAQSSVKTAVKQLKKTEHYEGFYLPGWALHLASKIIPSKEIDDETKGLFDILSHVRNIRIATTKLDVTKYNTGAIVKNFANKFKSSDHFEEYVSVRSEDNHLNIMVKEDNDIITNLLIMSEDQGSISLIHLKTNLTYNDLQKISFKQIREDSHSVKKANKPI